MFGIYLRTLLVVSGIFQYNSLSLSRETQFIFFINILSSPNIFYKTDFFILPPIKGIKYKLSVSRLYISPGVKSVSIYVIGIIVPIGNYYLHIYLFSY